MKGKITIEADGKRIQCEGAMIFENEIEEYEVVRSLTQAMEINTAEKWARLVAYCLFKLKDVGDLNNTKIIIPVKKENNNETDAH